MDKENLKKMDLTPIEDLIKEDFGVVGSPERDQFEMECGSPRSNWLIGLVQKRVLYPE